MNQPMLLWGSAAASEPISESLMPSQAVPVKEELGFFGERPKRGLCLWVLVGAALVVLILLGGLLRQEGNEERRIQDNLGGRYLEGLEDQKPMALDESHREYSTAKEVFGPRDREIPLVQDRIPEILSRADQMGNPLSLDPQGGLALETLTISNSNLKNFSMSDQNLLVLRFINNPGLVEFSNSHFPKLHTLIINSTSFETLSNLTFGSLKTLVILDSELQGRRIPRLDLGVEELTVQQSNMTAIDLEGFLSLKILKIQEHIPSFLNLSLPILEDLELSMDSLTSLTIDSERIQRIDKIQASSLQELSLSHTSLDSFTDQDFPSLKSLELIGNDISQVSIPSLKKLRSLKISDNQAPSLSISLSQSSTYLSLAISSASLISLSLNSMELIQFDLQTPGIKELSLSKMRDYSAFNLPMGLRKLSVQDSSLTGMVHQDFTQLASLSLTNITFTNSFRFPAPNLKSLRLVNIEMDSLDVSGYPQAAMELELPTLRAFTARNTHGLDDASFKVLALPTLRDLNLVNTSIQSFDQKILPSLTSLYLGEGQLKTVHLSAKGSNITELVVLNNPISMINGSLGTKVKTLTINISYGFFDSITLSDFQVSSLRNISTPHLGNLTLSNVRFTVAQPFQTDFPYLYTFKISTSNIQIIRLKRFPRVINPQFTNCPNLTIVKKVWRSDRKSDIRRSPQALGPSKGVRTPSSH